MQELRGDVCGGLTYPVPIGVRRAGSAVMKQLRAGVRDRVVVGELLVGHDDAWCAVGLGVVELVAAADGGG